MLLTEHLTEIVIGALYNQEKYRHHADSAADSQLTQVLCGCGDPHLN